MQMYVCFDVLVWKPCNYIKILETKWHTDLSRRMLSTSKRIIVRLREAGQLTASEKQQHHKFIRALWKRNIVIQQYKLTFRSMGTIMTQLSGSSSMISHRYQLIAILCHPFRIVSCSDFQHPVSPLLAQEERTPPMNHNSTADDIRNPVMRFVLKHSFLLIH